MRPAFGIAAAVLLAGVASAAAPVISVAAAADLRFALEELVAEFRQSHGGVEVRTTYGSSGNFRAQIMNGAPFDVFFSADAEYPRRLEKEGFAEPGSTFVYGVGRLVLWVPNASRLDLAATGLRAVLDPRVKRIAIANPTHAPYGRAAEAALRSLGLYEQVKNKLVLGENISQTAQFVESGAADAGLIAIALALAPPLRDAGRYVEVPADAYPRLEQAGVVLKTARDPAAATAFREFVSGPRGQEILRRFGFVAGVE
jgi:molybdate transport system substrate-binding protein